ncbi:MAG: alpha/beta fold hydrolase [Candidatus Saccharimonadales bacterium]
MATKAPAKSGSKHKPRAKSGKPGRFLSRHRHLRHILIGLALLLIVIGLLSLILSIAGSIRQDRLQPFYNTAGLPAKGPLGQIVRRESLGVKVDGGKAYRILYRTQQANGNFTFSSGRVFIPDNSNAGSPRPVVAWAHGTMGLGDQCAPSRTVNPIADFGWVSNMLKKGWVVTATDYAGFGTPGTQGYLVGGDEARDVLNSVRAVRGIPGAQAGPDFVVWGHSQGGASALFTASEAAAYAPELKLTGTVASAPAAELVSLLDQQYGSVADWVIGPLIMTSWPNADPALNPDDIMTTLGRDNYHRIADHCIGQSTLIGLVRNALGQKFFAVNPLTVPAWKHMAGQQSAPLLKPGQPLMVVESTGDKVVLPDTTALYIQQSCKAGVGPRTLWLGNVSHQNIPDKSEADVIPWIAARFAHQPNPSSCSQPLPVKPYAAS